MSMWVRLWSIVVVWGGLAAGAAAQPAGGPPPEISHSGEFIVASVVDAAGTIWLGAEDRGVYRYSAETDGWTQYTTKDGLGDNFVYALCCDLQGRVWAGHLNHGVSVFNGESWRNYDIQDGPLGERVFDIACCPTDGDVWIATSEGLSRYVNEEARWEYHGRLQGLGSNQVQCLAFAHDGTLAAGTQCDGLSIGERSRDGQYRWRNVRCPVQPHGIPLASAGVGLPSDEINDVLMTSDGALWVATPSGLATSRDKGRTFRFVRGRDWRQKVRGLYQGPNGYLNEPDLTAALAEDYVTTLAEGPQQKLLVGYRRAAVEMFDLQLGAKALLARDQKADDDGREYARTISVYEGQIWTGWYGGGVTRHGQRPAKRAAKSPPKTAAFPAPAGLTSAKLLASLTEAWKKPNPKPATIVYCDEDWRSQGTWIDRYGRSAAILCAMAGGGADLSGGRESAFFSQRAWIGPHCQQGDQIRRWVHWITTDNPRSLQNLSFGGRKQSEWDDHGEAYPFEHDGPHVYGTVKLPAGDFWMSLYFFNKDGHSGNNRFRDYLVDVRAMQIPDQMFHNLGAQGVDAQQLFERAGPGARTRVRDFWGGVHKRFFVRGPGYVTVRVDRHYSFNTILSSICFDRINDPLGEERPAFRIPSAPENGLSWDRVDEAAARIQAAELAVELLAARAEHGFAYCLDGPPARRLALRNLIERTPAGARAPAALATRVGKERLRWPAAALAHDDKQFAARDQILFPADAYELYGWTGRSRVKGDWTWEWAGYRAFLAEQRGRQTW